MKKGLLFSIVLSSFVAVSLATALNNRQIKETKAVEELSLTSGSDSFNLLEKSYAANESFVYTADLHFRDGQAGGLAFGAQEGDHYYVINMDRRENHVKLMYFATNGNGGWNVDELKVDYFIGNDKMTDSEKAIVNPQVEGIENVNLKVILTREEEHAYAEFFVEGIKRFGINTVIDLNDMGKSYTYQGGRIGMNCFNANVYLENIEYGKSDYSYFSEPYRNQYHLQPFAKWTNDPNALVYSDGWYHVYYQCHPFGLQWGPMYWGHARSRDLIHFEFLPICLFPDNGTMGMGGGDGYMWSGCAIDYKIGMSHDLDVFNWFPNNSGSGIFAILTREGPRQDQLIITSDDGGMTWTKRQLIPQSLSGVSDHHIDWRDPKIFPLRKEGTTVLQWGMTLSGMDSSTGWFLVSNNLIDWEAAGTFKFPRPECIGVGFIKDEENVEHAYLTNKSRSYILGSISYNSTTRKVEFIDETGHDLMSYSNADDIPMKPLDFGPDSYASQAFYIGDSNSEFYGKDIVINWFSGDLNADYCTGPGEYAGLRGRWNGGFTIPVEYGVKKVNNEYLLSQKPITVNNTNFEKTELVNVSNQNINSDSDNLLKDVHTHVFELEANITVNDNSPIIFKVDVGDNESMQFGWNSIDGYYVDRTYLDDKGINTNVDWHAKYASHIMGNSNTKTFYVLSDNGGLEVFCENYAVSFYFVTTASMYSTGASLKATDATVNSLKLSEVKSIYRKEVAAGEGVLYVSTNEVNLDNKFVTSKFVTAWYSGNEDLEWEQLAGEEVVSYEATNQGINIVALQQGEAKFQVSAGNQTETIDVIVHGSSFMSDLNFETDGVVSGQWIQMGDAIVGEKSSGNGFLLAEDVGTDFTFTGQFNIESGTAGALVFRAAMDMSSYLVANYDSGEHVVKLWSTHGELARSEVINVEAGSTITLSIKASGRDIRITLNGSNAIQYTLKDDEPLSGHFGLNVFSAKVKYKFLSILKENYEYTSGDLAVNLQVDQFVTAVYNLTWGNRKLEPGFYYQYGGSLYIKSSYFELLPSNGTYQFKVVGSSMTFNIKVEVNIAEPALVIDDVTTQVGSNVVVYVGRTAITSVKVNGEAIDNSKYETKDYTLHINAECFKEGENEVVLNDTISFTVNVENLDDTVVNKTEEPQKVNVPLIAGLSAGGALVLGGAAVLVIFLLKRRKV